MSSSDFVIENGVLKKYTGEGGDVVIPDGVTEIGYRVFQDCFDITSIAMPNSVTKIAEFAFRDCIGLESALLSDSVQSIGGGAFSGCFNLAEIVFPKGLTSIGWEAFYGCMGIESIDIPEGVTVIDSSSFAGCSSLTHINMPNTIKSIGYHAFAGCSGMESIVIPNSVTSIESSAFCCCTGLTSITIPDSVISIGNYAFQGCSGLININLPNSVAIINKNAFEYCSGLTNVIIPDGVTEIGESAFHSCKELKAVTFPDSLKNIRLDSFSHCAKLKEVFIPGKVEKIGVGAFEGCNDLESIEVSEENKTFKSVNNCIVDIRKKRLISACKNSVIPDDGSVTDIENRAFSCCKSITSIDIPNGIIKIGIKAFEWCANLASITIPASVESIAGNAFKYCFAITNIDVDKDNTAYCCSDNCLIETKSKTVLACCVKDNGQNVKTVEPKTESPADTVKRFDLSDHEACIKSFDKIVAENLSIGKNNYFLHENPEDFETDNVSDCIFRIIQLDDVEQLLKSYGNAGELWKERIGKTYAKKSFIVSSRASFIMNGYNVETIIPMLIAIRLFITDSFAIRIRIYRDKWEARGDYPGMTGPNEQVPPAVYWEINDLYPYGHWSAERYDRKKGIYVPEND